MNTETKGSEVVSPWQDPDVTHEYATLNGRRYHYLLGEPKDGPVKHTIVLIHGFQDLSFGWRYQIKPLVTLGLRVIAIDCMGYGRTEAPHVPPDSIRLYTFKRAADDIKELALQMGLSSIILGGHDWGGMIVTRTYLYYPELVSHIFTLGTPYLPPTNEWLDFKDYVAKYPTFKYQEQFAGKALEERLSTKVALRQFWIATYGGRGPNGEAAFSTERALFENWHLLIKSDVLTEEELTYYVEEYSRNGIGAALNWYRNRRENWEDELALTPTSKIEIPYLFVEATQDRFLPPSMSEGMELYIPDLQRRSSDATHFLQIVDFRVVNKHLRSWFEEVVLAGD